MSADPPGFFHVEQRDSESGARAGVIRTAHGEIYTPAFAPVATQGAVKAATPRDLEDLGAQLIMVNVYHLALRPGAETVSALGGIHGLSGWHGPIMADSGGYQVFSLGELVETGQHGATIRSPYDGSTHRFTPEIVISLHEDLGADLVMPLDICTPYPASRERAERDMAITHEWAARARAAHRLEGQTLYGIVQGSVYPDLRAESARHLTAAGFDAFAIGGVSVGESKEELMSAVRASVRHLPECAPRHLLGVGHADDLVNAVAHGIDTFDCVMPTRVARNAGVLTHSGRLNLRNAAFASDRRPLDENCTCYACRTFSRGAIRHLLKAREIAGVQLLTIHNLHFTLELVRDLRAAIVNGSFKKRRNELLAQLEGAE